MTYTQFYPSNKTSTCNVSGKQVVEIIGYQVELSDYNENYGYPANVVKGTMYNGYFTRVRSNIKWFPTQSEATKFAHSDAKAKVAKLNKSK